MRLMQMGYISYVVGETITPALKEGDLLIVASASGETNSVCQAVKSALCGYPETSGRMRLRRCRW